MVFNVIPHACCQAVLTRALEVRVEFPCRRSKSCRVLDKSSFDITFLSPRLTVAAVNSLPNALSASNDNDIANALEKSITKQYVVGMLEIPVDIKQT